MPFMTLRRTGPSRLRWLGLWFGAACGAVSAAAQTAWHVPTCTGNPLPFREGIRMPDAWEERWEAAWPEVSVELQAWRANNFASLQGLWRSASPCLARWTQEAAQHGLPPSAAFLPLWIRPDLHNPHAVPCTCDVPSAFWSGLAVHGSDGAEALAHMHRDWAQGTPVAEHPAPTLTEFASAVRTAVRLMENLAMPEVHVAKRGDTLYGLGRTYGVSPTCLSEANGVWNDLRPGTPLLVPNLQD